MSREIVLDTETTGIDYRSGHRLIEVACIEIRDLIPTGRHYHTYINPEREIEADAERVHGISNARVANERRFHEVCEHLLDFIADAPVVAHNADFDRGFINHELGLCGRTIIEPHRWVDTLAIARKRFPGMHNSLDALCKRFKISLAERELHGALIDARLLADVYLELRGGRERGLDLTPAAIAGLTRAATQAVGATSYGARPRPLAPRSTEAERAAHAAFVAKVLKDNSLWSELEAAVAQAERAEA